MNIIRSFCTVIRPAVSLRDSHSFLSLLNDVRRLEGQISTADVTLERHFTLYLFLNSEWLRKLFALFHVEFVGSNRIRRFEKRVKTCNLANQRETRFSHVPFLCREACNKASFRVVQLHSIMKLSIDYYTLERSQVVPFTKTVQDRQSS